MGNLKFIVALLGIMFLSHGIAAIDYSNLDWVEKEGVIRKINLAERTAVISGYKYTFGNSSGFNQPTVKLLNSNYGALELLEVGMKVQFHFVVESGTFRRMLYLQQLPDNTWQDNHELPDAHPFHNSDGTLAP